MLKVGISFVLIGIGLGVAGNYFYNVGKKEAKKDLLNCMMAGAVQPQQT
ncbi:hypothetical protein V7306_19265 [Neobacillus vireti]